MHYRNTVSTYFVSSDLKICKGWTNITVVRTGYSMISNLLHDLRWSISETAIKILVFSYWHFDCGFKKFCLQQLAQLMLSDLVGARSQVLFSSDYLLCFLKLAILCWKFLLSLTVCSTFFMLLSERYPLDNSTRFSMFFWICRFNISEFVWTFNSILRNSFIILVVSGMFA